MSHADIIETLSEAINAADKHGDMGTGDKLMEVVAALKADWNMED